MNHTLDVSILVSIVILRSHHNDAVVNHSKKKQQRTNGPVNAHLKSGPTISTKTSFAKIDIVME